MSDKPSDTQEILPTIAPSQDDIASRRNTRRAEPASARSRSSAATLVVNLLLILAFAGLLGCGWFISAQNEALAQAREERNDAFARLQRIEGRLALTDEALNQSDEQTEDQLQYWESEIRKLWDVSNKRNRTWIEENQASVARLTEQLAAQSRSIGEVRAQATDLRRAIGTQEQILEQITLLDRRAADLLRQQRALTDTANTLEQTTTALDRRVADTEEAIEAIDGFRRDTNARLTRLQDRLGAGSSAPSPSTVTPTPGP